MRVADLVSRLAERTHPERAADWDSVGLQVGDPDAEVRSIAVVHEVTESVVDRLEPAPVDLVVAYHPLLFRPAARMVPDRSPAGRAARLLRAGTAVLVTHSDFDVMPGGMADAMADALGLSDVTGFAPVAPSGQVKVVTFVPSTAAAVIVDALSTAGAGTIGDYHACAFTVDGTGRFVAGSRSNPLLGEPGSANQEAEVRVEMIAPRRRLDAVVGALLAAHPYEEPAFDVYATESNHLSGGRVGAFAGSWDDLLAAVEAQFQPAAMRVAALETAVPRRVAVSPGAGESRIAPAAAAGCDVLVSGDISHHRMVEANDRGLSVIDPGHAATEGPGMARLHALVADCAGDEVDTVIAL
jgi:dinuclear metal center YbgI/SA1388 family protein